MGQAPRRSLDRNQRAAVDWDALPLLEFPFLATAIIWAIKGKAGRPPPRPQTLPEPAVLPISPFFGGSILETLTIGMYGEARNAICEYIQNGFDWCCQTKILAS